MAIRAALVLAVFLLVNGCAEYEARKQAEERAEAATIAANEDAQCRSYGAERGSPAYVQCRMNFDNQRAQARAIILQSYLSRR